MSPDPPRKLMLRILRSVLCTLRSDFYLCAPPPLSKILDPPLLQLNGHNSGNLTSPNVSISIFAQLTIMASIILIEFQLTQLHPTMTLEFSLMTSLSFMIMPLQFKANRILGSYGQEIF